MDDERQLAYSQQNGSVISGGSTDLLESEKFQMSDEKTRPPRLDNGNLGRPHGEDHVLPKLSPVDAKLHECAGGDGSLKTQVCDVVVNCVGETSVVHHSQHGGNQLTNLHGEDCSMCGSVQLADGVSISSNNVSRNCCTARKLQGQSPRCSQTPCCDCVDEEKRIDSEVHRGSCCPLPSCCRRSQNKDSKSSKNLVVDHLQTSVSVKDVEAAVDAVVSPTGDDDKTVQCGAADSSTDGRETWDKKMDFLLSIIGFAVDLANVWRFPYLCYKNGGGAFLIPYFMMLIFGALPLFFMELVLGQYHRQGAIAVWKIAPLFKGIGMCQCLIAFYVAFYYNVIIAWSLYYLASSFTFTLPWTTCGNEWNTPLCSTGNDVIDGNGTDVNVTLRNVTVSSAAEYFERAVLGLHLSPGLSDVGVPRWPLVLCLAAVFSMIYLSLWKGVKTSGKVVWVTATMPYVVLSILLVRGLMLPGSLTGIMYYITPRLDRLHDSQVWIDAAIQIFYSVGAGFGVHIAFASYNKFSSNCYRDCLATVCVNSFTSLFSGLVIFSYLGYMAVRQNKDISVVNNEGPGLVFVVYPEAIATLPGSVVWSILFFFMLITLGLDSAMGGLEALLTGVSDELKPLLKRYRFGREALTGLVCGSAFLFATQNITNGGMYLFHMWDTFAAGTAILFGVFAQAIAISWFYGLEQFCQDIEQMLGFRPCLYWRLCWKFISPVFILVIILSSVISFKPLAYDAYTIDDYTYPYWANVIGWLIVTSSVTLVPTVALYQLCKQPGPWTQKFALSISPYWEHKDIMDGKKVKRFQRRHWLAV